jgi:hypothetical protein
LPYNIRNY